MSPITEFIRHINPKEQGNLQQEITITARFPILAQQALPCDNAVMSPETFDCELLHGIKLTIENPSKATLAGVADFLAQAMAYFKEQRDVRKTAEYSDGP